jgi:hypothetical protein
MATSRGVPVALRVFCSSLFVGLVGGYGAFRVAFWLGLKFLRGEYAEALAMALAVLAALSVGVASAVTAGVLAGKRAESTKFNA